ncbi:MAG: helix-turn-helix domain-containing protein [Oscillospiraceae bacterium]|nr:helix-turn-helix domain-containing protein [Oscillospiraceae bacterium]
MGLSAAEKIKIIAKRRGMTMGEIADRRGESRQNLSNKIRRDNFSERELREIAEVLNCTLSIEFVFKDTNERI